MKRMFLFSVLSLFVSFLPLSAADAVILPADVPLFSTENFQSAPFFVTEEPLQTELLDMHPLRLAKHPLARKTQVWKLSVQGNTCYCLPDMRAEKTFREDQPGKIFLKYHFLEDSLRTAFGGILIFLACVSVFLYFRKRELSFRKYLLPAALILLQTGVLLYMTGKSGVVPEPVDEKAYFEAAKGIACGDFKGPWSYTIGWPLLESIFIELFRFKDYFSAEDFLLALNGFVLMNGILLAAYLIFLHLSKSETKAFLALFLWRMFSVFWTFIDFWHPDRTRWSENFCKGVFSMPGFGQSYRTYLMTTSFGYNALSDTLSMFCIFLLILEALKMKPKIRNLIAFGAFFGFACLVRLNNIFFAFLFMFLLWKKYDVSRKEWKKILIMFFAGAIPFLSVISLQFAVNRFQFGNLFTFPYSLHDPEVSKGFLFRYVRYNIPFLIKANYVYFMPGLVFLLFMKDRFLKTVLFLWIVPLTVFFFGYSQSYNNGIRFLLPVLPALCACIVLSRIWDSSERRKMILPAVILLAVLLFTTPTEYAALNQLLPWNFEYLSCGVMLSRFLNIALPVFSAMIAGFVFGKEKSLFFFTLFLLLFYASGCVWLVPAAMAAVILSLVFVFLHPGKDPVHDNMPKDLRTGR